MPLKQWIKRQIKKVIGAPLQQTPTPVRAGALRNNGVASHKLEDVVNHYEKHWEAYQEVCGEVIQSGRPTNTDELLIFEMTSSGMADGEHILDAGCGVCGPAIWFAKRKQITIDAVTISPNQYARAQKAIVEANLPDRVKVHLGDYNKLEDLFPANTFDRVYFLESICHAVNYRQVLASVAKVLKPGGTLYIKDFFERVFDDPATQKRADEFRKKAYAEYSFALIRHNEMAALLQEAGFKLEFAQPSPFSGDTEDHSYMANFEKKVGFRWTEGCDLWVFEGYEMRARKPVM